MRILVTGGAGFIGSTFLNLMVPRHPEIEFINIDKLTYAANPANCSALVGRSNYRFIQADIVDLPAMMSLFAELTPDKVVHFAAESHVDRSIVGVNAFLQTNIIGTVNLLECCRQVWPNADGHLFHHVSTDEVYGSLGSAGKFTESSPYDPHNPYSASKASSDHFVRSYHHTHGLPVVVTNCSNNYGPRQFPEKMIPLMILHALEGKPLPVYGDGQQIRDWLYVEDHCLAIWDVLTRGRSGETYNIGGNAEMTNLGVVQEICRLVAAQTGNPLAELERLITFVADRPGHDRRYAIDAGKIQRELHWQPLESFATGLEKTVRWYLAHMGWVEQVRTAEYQGWLGTNYAQREGAAR